MPIGGGIALLVIGGILTFALTGSIKGLDLHVVGVILMLAGALGLVLPLLTRTRSRSNRPPARSRMLWNRSRTHRPEARSRQDVIDDEPQTLVQPPGHDPAPNDDRRSPDRRRPWAGKGRG